MLRTPTGQRPLGADGRPSAFSATGRTRSPLSAAQRAVDDQVSIRYRWEPRTARQRLRLSPADEEAELRTAAAARQGLFASEAETVRPLPRPTSSRSPPTARTLAADVERAGRQFQGPAGPSRIVPAESLREQTEALQAAIGNQTAGIAGSIGLVEDTIGQQTTNLVDAIRQAAARDELDERQAAQALHNLRDHPLTADLVQRGVLKARQVVDLATVNRMERNLRTQQISRGNDGTEQQSFSTRLAARETPMQMAHNQPTQTPGVFIYRPPRFARPE